jgi:hypothetical protein
MWYLLHLIEGRANGSL